VQLAADASPYGQGAVISHITKEGEERPIAYASLSLTPAEKKVIDHSRKKTTR